ncbi:hypothetical protein D920_00595 [Enterococcus faecalis 13-SD-W-01]|nr:hypothetical protein D920_00595 [Enterococcus faecalis 13-SD-W-01]
MIKEELIFAQMPFFWAIFAFFLKKSLFQYVKHLLSIKKALLTLDFQEGKE